MPVHAIQIGQALFVILLVLDQLDDGAAFPVVELERAGANGMVVVFVIAEIGTCVKVFGHHGKGACFKREQERTKRLLQGEYHGVVVGSFDAFHMLQHCAGTGVQFTVENISGKHYVLSGEGFTIVPGNVVAKVEGISAAIITDFP